MNAVPEDDEPGQGFDVQEEMVETFQIAVLWSIGRGQVKYQL